MKIGTRVIIDEVDGLPTTRSGSGIIVSAQDKCCDETCLGRMITVRVDKNNPMIETLGYDHFDVEVCITAVRLEEEKQPTRTEFSLESATGQFIRSSTNEKRAILAHEPRELLPHECFYVGVEPWVDETAECSGNKATCPRHGRAAKRTVLAKEQS